MWAIPIAKKNNNAEILKKINNRIKTKFGQGAHRSRLLYFVRTDNENAWDGEFARYLESQQITNLRASPYCPQSNGLAERCVRNVTSALRSIMVFCDKSVWCFAMEHYSKLWNRVKKNKDGKTPQETLEDELLDVDDPRRTPPVKLEHLPYFIFGSLAIVYKSNPIQNKSDLLSGKLSFAPRCCFANVSYVQL